MKKLRKLILCLFVLLMLISCQTVYYFGAEQPITKSENELEVLFFLDTIKPNIQINFLFNSNTSIIDFELTNWFFQVGDNIIEFDLNNINFSSTEIETNYFLTYFHNGKYDEIINTWNEKYQNEYEKKSNNFQYKFWMTRYVDRQLADEIREKNISFLKVYLEFTFMKNNEKYYHIIDEDFTIKVEKGYFTIFDVFNPAIY